MNTYKLLRNLLVITSLGLIFGCSGSSSQNALNNGSINGKKTAKVLTNDLQITTDPNDQATPAVAYDSVNSQYLTVWTDYRNGANNTDIYGKICKGTGSGSSTSTTCGAEFQITGAPGNQSQPKVAFYPTGSKFLVIWTDTRAGYGQIYGQFVTSVGTTGSQSGGELLISDHIITNTADNGINQSDPDIVYDPIINKFVVAWVDKSIFDTDKNPANVVTLLGTKCSNSIDLPYIPLPIVDNSLVRTVEINPADGTRANKREVSQLVGSVPIADTGSEFDGVWKTQSNEASPKIGLDRNGNYFVAWSGTTHTVKLAVKYTVGTIPAGATTGLCTYIALFTGTDDDAGKPKIKIRQNDGLGLVTDLSFGIGNALFPTIATDPNTNRTLLAWEEDQQIQGQLIDLQSFVPYAPLIPVSVGSGPRTAPAAAFDNVNQRFLVTWEDGRTGSASLGNIDIYSQFVDPQGALSGGNTIVTVAPGNQLVPAVAFGDVNFRDFFVVWKDARVAGNSDIFGQLLEFSTLPQLMITDTTGNQILSGSLDFGTVDLTSTTLNKEITILIRNDGNSRLHINNISDPNITNQATPFTIITPKPVDIDPGTSFPLTIRFAPTGAGSYSGDQIDFNSNGGNATLTLSGIGKGVKPLTVATTSLPDGQASIAYTATTLTASGGNIPYGSWTRTSGNLPPGLILTTTTGGNGLISGTIDSTASGSYSFTVSVTDSANPPATATKVLTINVTSVTIVNTALKPWTQGQSGYSETLTSSGGVGGSTWSISAGSGAGTLSPVPGLTLNPSTGDITGTPTASGSFSFTVKVTDGAGKVATKQLNININPALSVTTSSLPGTVVNSPYSQNMTASGGTLPYTWSVSGSLPTGVALTDLSNGTIKGTTGGNGTFTFTVQVTDAVGATATRQLSITISPVLDLTTVEGTLAQDATAGTPYSFSFKATGGSGFYEWSIVSGSLPTGLTLSSITGIVSGTTVLPGTYTFSVLVKDKQFLNTVFKTYFLNVIDSSSTGGANVFFSDQAGSVITSQPFDNVFNGTSLKKTVTIHNSNQKTVSIVSVTSSSSEFFTNLPALFDLTAGTTKDFDVFFIPTGIKTFAGNLVLTDSVGTKYTLSLSGTGSPLKVVTAAANGTVGTVTPLSPSQVPLATIPANITVTSAGEFTITGLTSSPATVTLTFDSSVFPASPLFYSIDNNGKWNPITGTVSGNTFTYSLSDNDPSMDKDTTANSIRSLVAVGTTSTTGTTGTGGTTGAGSAPPSSGGKSGCFIATAAFGSYLDPHVVVLRNFRDNFLLKSKLGTAFVRFYYAYSPPIADFISDHIVLRTVTRWMLTPLIYAVEYSQAVFSVIAMLALCWFGLYRRNRNQA